jgi:phosphoserine phosphatase
MTQLVLIRHGETDWNITGRYQGQANPSLNRTGIQQARKLATFLEKTGLTRIISSPLQRAAQTAEILVDTLNIPLEFDSRLMEIHQGEWQTRLRSEIQAQYSELFQQWETQPWSVTPPGGESLQAVKNRVTDAANDIIQLFPTDRVGIVTHRIPIAILKIEFQSLNPDIVRSIHLPNIYFELIEPSSHRWGAHSATS